MGEERKLATVVFADIVGSTAYGEAHDPEIVREALAHTFATWREVLVAHGGTVEKFIGDAVMAVFGVPVAHEDDPERALRAAFALRERVRTADDAPFEIRIGIASGEVVSGGAEDGGQFLVTGPSANLAARLVSAASAGEILVDPSTKRLTAHVAAYDGGRPVEAKGIGRVEAHPARDLFSAIPSARPAFGELRAPLVGRARELEALSAALARAREGGRPARATVVGPAGIGKSRLVDEWIARGAAHALCGRCLPYGEGVMFWPLKEMLFADAEVAPTDTRDAVAAKIGAAATRALGDTDVDAVSRRLLVMTGTVAAGDALPHVRPEGIAEELRWALRRYLEGRARDGLALVFEDLQWAEQGLLDLIDGLVEWATAPILVVCVARPELREAHSSWGTDGATVELDALGYEETRALVGGLLGMRHAPTDLVDDICARADGNPLYVEEFLRAMIDTARITRVEDEWLVARGLAPLVAPPTLHGLIAARLDRIPADVKRAVQLASVIGRRFSTDALEGVAAAPVEEAVLAEGVRRGILAESTGPAAAGGRSYAFHHGLAREVAYASVPKGERMRMHDRLSRWLETSSGDRASEYVEQVAFHAEQAYRLARDLRAARANELGRRAFGLLVSAATGARRRSDLGAAMGLYARAAEIGEAIGLPLGERVEAEGFAALTGYYIEGTADAVARLDRIIEAARANGPSEVLVRLLSQRGFIARVDERADRFFDEGLEVARATGDAALISHAMTLANAQAWARGDLLAQEALLREAYDLMRRTSATADLGVCLVWLATNAMQRGDFTDAQRYLDEATAEAQASGSKFQLWAVRRQAARAAIARGDHTLAARLANEAVTLAHEVGAKRLVGLAHVRLGDALSEAGAHVEARSILEQALSSLDSATMREAYSEVQWKLARAALATGDRAAARTHAAAAREIASDLYSRATAAATLAAVRDADGDRAGAEALYREALEAIASTGFGQLRATIQLDLARHYVGYGDVASAEPLIETVRAFYRDPLAARRRDEAIALRRAGEAALPA